MLNVDGWMDGRTYERTNKLARLCLPAKAGVTKIKKGSNLELTVLALCTISDGPLSMYQVSFGSLLYRLFAKKWRAKNQLNFIITE